MLYFRILREGNNSDSYISYQAELVAGLENKLREDSEGKCQDQEKLFH